MRSFALKWLMVYTIFVILILLITSFDWNWNRGECRRMYYRPSRTVEIICSFRGEFRMYYRGGAEIMHEVELGYMR